MKKINIVFLFHCIFHHFIFCNKNIIDSVLSICSDSKEQIKTNSVDKNNIINQDKNIIPIDSVLTVCDNSQEEIKKELFDRDNIHKDKIPIKPFNPIIENNNTKKSIKHYNKYNIKKQKNNNYIINPNHTKISSHKKKLKKYKKTSGKRNNQNSKRTSHRIY